MGASLEFVLLCICWLSALATLLIFLETCFSLSPRNRFTARRASGAYGVISVLVPMRGPREKLERTIQSIFNQSYPFIELFLIYPQEDLSLEEVARGFQSARSHIPVRLVETAFSISSPTDCIRALERAQGSARGRWLVTLDADVILDRFAIETAVEFAGSNEIAALALRHGIRCRTLLEKCVAPAMAHFTQVMRTVKRRHQTQTSETNAPFRLVHKEAFEAVNRINQMPGILNETGWSIWNYQIEGLRTFEGDGSAWIWRDFDIHSGETSAGVALVAALLAVIAPAGVVFGLLHGREGFAGASILAFSAVSYALLAIGYFLFARRYHGATWCAAFWFVPHLAGAVASLPAYMRLNRTRSAEASSVGSKVDHR
jgi:glycosyl transferase family 2